jgi:hypothetical protein
VRRKSKVGVTVHVMDEKMNVDHCGLVKRTMMNACLLQQKEKVDIATIFSSWVSLQKHAVHYY